MPNFHLKRTNKQNPLKLSTEMFSVLPEVMYLEGGQEIQNWSLHLLASFQLQDLYFFA